MKTKFAFIAAALVVIAMLFAPMAVLAAPPTPTIPARPAVSSKVEAEVQQLLKSKAEIKGGGGNNICEMVWVSIQVPASPWKAGKSMTVFVTPTFTLGEYCEPEIMIRTEEQVYHNPAPASGNARMVELTWNTPGEKLIDVAVFDRNSGQMKSNTARVMILPEELTFSLLENRQTCVKNQDCVVHIKANHPLVAEDLRNGSLVGAMVRSDNSSMELIYFQNELTEYHFTYSDNNNENRGFWLDLYTAGYGWSWTWVWMVGDQPNVCPITPPSPTPTTK